MLRSPDRVSETENIGPARQLKRTRGFAQGRQYVCLGLVGQQLVVDAAAHTLCLLGTDDFNPAGKGVSIGNKLFLGARFSSEGLQRFVASVAGFLDLLECRTRHEESRRPDGRVESTVGRGQRG